VLFSSHQIGQVERAADSIAVLMRGGKLVLARRDRYDLKGDEKIVEAIFPSDAPSAERSRLGRHACGASNAPGASCGLHVRSDADGRRARDSQAFEPRTVDVLDLGLEDIFLGAVSDDAAYSSAKDRA
jgi:ABC-type multidrug transport system ATPase subunit